MGRGKSITVEEKAKIDAYEDHGLSGREISRKINRSANVVCNYIKNKQQYGKNMKGRQTMATTATERRNILRIASNSGDSAAKIKNKSGSSASLSTLRRIINAGEHLKRIKLQKKTPLNQQRMSEGNVCRLCVNICQDYKCIYDQNGHENETYQLMMKYFDSTFLNMDNGGYLSVMCLECWGHILDFNNFQQSVYKAQQRLNDTEQKPEIIAENELNSKDVGTYHTCKELENPQKVYIKTENNSTVEVSSQANGETICYVITRQEDDLLPNTSQAFGDVSVKREDAILLEKNHTAQEETALTKPKIEIVDVYSGDDASQETFSDDASGIEVIGGCKDSTFLNRQSTNPTPLKDALTKKKFIEDSDEFIKQWNPNLACSFCSETCSTYSLLRQHFLEQHPLEKCYIMCCERKFYQRYVIEDHIRYHIDPNAFKCEHCDKRHTTRRQLADHVRFHHSKSNNELKTTLKRKVTTDQEIDELIFQWKPILECAVCKEKYNTLKLLQTHFRQGHPEEQFYIECCYRKLKKRYDIEDHARNHINPITFTCEFCSLPFSTQSNLMRHLRNQHSKLNKEEVKPSNKKRITDKELEELVARWKPSLECVICRITCPTLKTLQVHFRQSHPVKQFYLECCHRKFKRRYDIEFHARSHVDPITFTCEICTNRFSTQSNLMRHTRIYHSSSRVSSENEPAEADIT